MSARSWSLTVDHLGRPTTTNRAHNMHYRAVSADRKQWREAGCVLARAERIPRLDCVELRVQGRYPDRRSLPDADAIAPAVKGVIDGLVDAGVLEDDGPAYVAAITYLRPVVEPGLPAALVIAITETAPPTTPDREDTNP